MIDLSPSDEKIQLLKLQSEEITCAHSCYQSEVSIRMS